MKTTEIILIIVCLLQTATIIYQIKTIKDLNKYIEILGKIKNWWQDCAEWWKLYAKSKDNNIDGVEPIHTPDEKKTSKISL